MLTFEEIIACIYQVKDGLVIAELHYSRAPLKFLIDNADKLKKLGIKYLFTEKFCSDDDIHIRFLSNLHNDEYVAKNIDYVCQGANKYFNWRSDWFIEEKYTMQGLIYAMRNNGIEIVGINSAHLVDKFRGKFKPGDNTAFIEYTIALNVHMERIIKAYLLNIKHKWIALVGNKHGSNYMSVEGRMIEGLSEKLNIPSLHLFEREVNPVLHTREDGGGGVDSCICDIAYHQITTELNKISADIIGDTQYADFLFVFQVKPENKRILLEERKDTITYIGIESFYKLLNINKIYIHLIKYCIQPEEIEWLFQNKELQRFIVENGYGSLLHLAVSANNEKAVIWLLSHSLSMVNFKNGNDELPIHLASSNLNITKILIANGSLINAKTADGNIPLHFVARGGNTEIMHLLFENGTVINIKNKKYESPLMWANSNQQVHASQLLRERGALNMLFSIPEMSHKVNIFKILDFFTPKTMIDHTNGHSLERTQVKDINVEESNKSLVQTSSTLRN